MGLEGVQASAISAICWSCQPPPTAPWLPGNQTCFRFVVVLSSSRSQRQGAKARRGSSIASAWKAFSTLGEICVSVNFHVRSKVSSSGLRGGGLGRDLLFGRPVDADEGGRRDPQRAHSVPDANCLHGYFLLTSVGLVRVPGPVSLRPTVSKQG